VNWAQVHPRLTNHGMMVLCLILQLLAFLQCGEHKAASLFRSVFGALSTCWSSHVGGPNSRHLRVAFGHSPCSSVQTAVDVACVFVSLCPVVIVYAPSKHIGHAPLQTCVVRFLLPGWVRTRLLACSALMSHRSQHLMTANFWLLTRMSGNEPGSATIQYRTSSLTA
jgi:hypothetical protein